MSNLKRILSSFKVRESLNPKIWVKKDNEIVMNPKVREKLLEVANDFIEYLKVDVVVTDIIMTGSLANFNWSSFSDVDLHIVADFSQFPEEQLDLYKELFTLKKTLYNEKHDITIYGYDVELYVQNETEAHFSSGVYSVLYNEWSNKPKKENVKIDTSLIKTKTNQWMDIIDGVIKNASDEPIDNARQIIKKYKDKLKKYRTCGLEKQGEYSDENLVFKVLRRNGYIEKLHDFENKLVDKTYTLKEGETSIGGPFKTDIENGPSNHGKRAFGNWQSDNAWDVFAPPGSVVNAYTEGKVIKIRNTNKRSGKVFGTQVTVKGEGNFPDIFYTHLKNVKLSVGDSVKLGDYVGEVTEWCKDESCTEMHNGTHVHIGLPKGRHIKELLVNSDKIFTGSESTSPSNSTSTAEKPSESVGEKDFADKLIELKNLNQTLNNLKPSGQTLEFNPNVETIQIILQILGFSLPKWGIDGKFGNETEQAVKDFQKANGLTETGVITKEEINKLIILISKKVTEDPSVLDKIQKTKTATISTDTTTKPTETVTSSEKPTNKVSSTSDNEYAIIKPEGYTGNRVHVLFGGSHTSGYSKNSAKPEAIKKYINVMTPYANNIIIVVTHHMNSLANVRAYVKEKFGGEVSSLAGFSQGGREAWSHADDSSLSLVGLIDPSTYETGLPFGSNTILYCDPKNWGTSGFYGQTRKRLEWYCENKDKYGSKVVCFNKGGSHMNFGILKSFYEQYGSKM
jgi:peptidoglycan hydrolase-like protein with peptidoglycan-binding domain/predicted nucleotidyltransferase